MKINYDYLRPKKATQLKLAYDQPIDKKESLNVFHYKNAVILPFRSRGELPFSGYGGVVDEQGVYISESALPQTLEGSYPFLEEQVAFVDKKVVFCGWFIHHWGHFLLDSIARLWYTQQNDDSIDEYVFVIDEKEELQVTGNFKEFFQLLGIWDKLRFINRPQRYREVVIPELSFLRFSYYTDEYKNIFETIISNCIYTEEAVPLKKIFLTRSSFNKANQTEFALALLDDYFEKNGYRIIAPEKITLSQLIYYLQNCQEYASISGTTAHNSLFAKEGSQFLVIERQALNNMCQRDFNCIKKLDVTYIDAHYAIYPVDPSVGPFLFAFTPEFKKYCEAKADVRPDVGYLDQKYLNTCFEKYINCCMEKKHYRWLMKSWVEPHLPVIYESYAESLKVYGKRLKRGNIINKYHFYLWFCMQHFFEK